MTTTSEERIVIDIIDHYPGQIDESALHELDLAPNVLARLVSHYPDCVELTTARMVDILCEKGSTDEFRVQFAKNTASELSTYEVHKLITSSGRMARGQLVNIFCRLQQLTDEAAFAYIMSSTPDQITKFAENMEDRYFRFDLSQKIALCAASTDPSLTAERLRLPKLFHDLLLK